jgi:excisionase family DNA binding protein
MSTSDRAGVAPVANPPRALTAADLAAALQVSVRTVRRMIAAGEVHVIRFGRSVRVPAEEANRLLGAK